MEKQQKTGLIAGRNPTRSLTRLGLNCTTLAVSKADSSYDLQQILLELPEKWPRPGALANIQI